MADPLCLLTVHAHPDDEASKGSATVARYHAEGVRTVLVCCTGGEEGDILNPAVDTPEVRADLAAVRHRELLDAADIIGYDIVEMLGYRDSGMADSPANDHPDCFARADLDEAVDRLVGLIRRHRPHVIVTYADDQQGYRHPDHIRVNEISVPAFDRAADPAHRPDLGAPWQPLKLYYTTWSRARIEALHAKYLELGIDSPYDEGWFTRPSTDDVVTTRVEVSEWYDARVGSLLAHRTQVDPESRFWFGLPAEVARHVHPWDDYVRARSLVDAPDGEDDLFAGVRAVAEAR